MRKFFTFIAFSILLSSCKQNESKTVPDQKIVKNDSIQTNDSAQTATLDSDLLELFSKNKNAVILKLKSISKEEANALYHKYYEENGYLLHKIDEKEAKTLEVFYNEDATSKKAVTLLENKLLKHQLKYDEIGEGYVEITTENDFYYKIFKDYVTADYKDYLYLKSEENKSPYSADAGLIITFKDLGDRIISWENFMSKYPNSQLIKSVKEEYKYYQLDYLMGEDNTPTVERANEIYIYPENLKEFDRFEKKYPKSPTIPLIHLLKENFKNDDVSDLLRAAQEKL